MADKKRKFIIGAFFIIIFFLSATSALALEVNYPTLPIPGLPTITNGSGIEALAKYYFTIGIYIAGIITLISFTVGAIGLINPNIEAHNEAKDRMKNSILGLALTLASFLIINTINTDLVKLDPISVGPGSGLVFFNGTEDTKLAPGALDNTAKRPEGYSKLKYICSGGYRLIVIKYPNISYLDDEAYSNTTIERLSCGKETDISGIGSYETLTEYPGVYIYLKPGCQGLVSGAFVGDQNEIPQKFLGKVKSIGIVSEPATKSYYGTILHKVKGTSNGGLCARPIGSIEAEEKNPLDFCEDVNMETSAMSVYALNKEYKTSGDGVVFFSEPYGWDTGAAAGFYSLAVDKIGNAYNNAACNFKFSYTNIDRPEAYRDLYKTFDQRPGSIQVKGSYVVALFSGNSSNTENGPNVCPCLPPKTGTCPNTNYRPCPGSDSNSETGPSTCPCTTSPDGQCPNLNFGPCPEHKPTEADGLCSPSNPNGYCGSDILVCDKGFCKNKTEVNKCKNITTGSAHCQVFRSNAPNLNAEAFVASGGTSINGVYIFPVK